MVIVVVHYFFFSSRRRHTRSLCDWSSDVCSSDLPRIVRPRLSGGFGIDAQWSDDIHHAVHTMLTGEQSGYYEDFGELERSEERRVGKEWRTGWARWQGKTETGDARHAGRSNVGDV